jgi:hypothetical protein
LTTHQLPSTRRWSRSYDYRAATPAAAVTTIMQLLAQVRVAVQPPVQDFVQDSVQDLVQESVQDLVQLAISEVAGASCTAEGAHLRLA